jgi:hypothetical protein
MASSNACMTKIATANETNLRVGLQARCNKTGDRCNASKDQVHPLQICLSSLLVKTGWRPKDTSQ